MYVYCMLGSCCCVCLVVMVCVEYLLWCLYVLVIVVVHFE